MPNQPLEDSVENLRHRLRFLPEAEREAEVAEFRSHLQERLSAYENAGETPERALSSALQKWGEPTSMVRALRQRWVRRKIDHPVIIAILFLGLGQYLIYGLNVLLSELYQIVDPMDRLAIIPLFQQFAYNPSLPIRLTYILVLFTVHCLVITGAARLVAGLHLKNQRKGVALYTGLYLAKMLWQNYQLASLGMWSSFGRANPQDFLTNTPAYFQSLMTILLGTFFVIFPQVYSLLITLFVLRSKKPASLPSLENEAA